MKQSKIKVEDLAREIMTAMGNYVDAANVDMKIAVQKAAKTAKKEVEARAPKKTGKYSKSFVTQKTNERTYAVEYTVWSPTDYRRVHLLEKGHAKRGGGRTRAFPHMEPAEQVAAEQLEKDITEIFMKRST